jgi:hypothetical protein
MVHIWIWRKIKRRIPAEIDPVTLEPIQKPVTIYDMKRRWQHTFEASTLFNNIRAQLRNSNYGWPHPVLPRNPYTNSQLTPYQVWSARNQLLSYGLACWELEAFVEKGMHIDVYTRGHIISLYQTMRLRELDTRDPSDGQESLVEFIEEMASMNGVYITANNLYVLNRAPINADFFTHPYVVTWRLLYKRYLEYCSDVALDGHILMYSSDSVERSIKMNARSLLLLIDEFCEEYMDSEGV